MRMKPADTLSTNMDDAVLNRNTHVQHRRKPVSQFVVIKREPDSRKKDRQVVSVSPVRVSSVHRPCLKLRWSMNIQWIKNHKPTHTQTRVYTVHQMCQPHQIPCESSSLRLVRMTSDVRREKPQLTMTMEYQAAEEPQVVWFTDSPASPFPANSTFAGGRGASVLTLAEARAGVTLAIGQLKSQYFEMYPVTMEGRMTQDLNVQQKLVQPGSDLAYKKEDSVFEKRCQELKVKLQRRGYPGSLIDAAMRKVSDQPRASTLQYSRRNQQSKADRVPFIVRHNPQ
ncbi:hypothetical protein ACOMHN_052422 [Nucella lapillus]